MFKSITADAQVCNKPCWLIYASLYHDGKTNMKIYDEVKDGSLTATLLFDTLAVDDANGDPTDRAEYPERIFMKNGIYADWTAGVGTIVYELY